MIPTVTQRLRSYCVIYRMYTFPLKKSCLCMFLVCSLVSLIIIIMSRFVIWVVHKTTSSQIRKEDHGLPLIPAQHIQSMSVRIGSLVPPNGVHVPTVNRTFLCLSPTVLRVYTTVHFSHNRSGPFWHGSVFYIIRS